MLKDDVVVVVNIFYKIAETTSLIIVPTRVILSAKLQLFLEF